MKSKAVTRKNMLLSWSKIPRKYVILLDNCILSVFSQLLTRSLNFLNTLCTLSKKFISDFQFIRSKRTLYSLCFPMFHFHLLQYCRLLCSFSSNGPLEFLIFLLMLLCFYLFHFVQLPTSFFKFFFQSYLKFNFHVHHITLISFCIVSQTYK